MQCNKCGTEKPIDQFKKDSRSKLGRKLYCKVCAAENAKAWYHSNTERGKVSRKSYREQNKEKVKIGKREYYQKNREACISRSKIAYEKDPSAAKVRNKAWRKANADHLKAWMANWRRENNSHLNEQQKERYKKTPESFARSRLKWERSNPEKVRAYCAEYRARKIFATPAWANQKYIVLWYEVARLEEERTGRKCHVDHIVPLNSPVVCGLHNEFNLQVMFAEDNIKKGNRHAT